MQNSTKGKTIPDQEINVPAQACTAYTPISTPEALGQAVRRARKSLGLTQPQLAMAAGVGVRFMVELEAGKPTLRLEHILRVLHALGGSLGVAGLSNLAGGSHGVK